MIPVVFIVGADKGGVGKTMVSRALIDYFTVANRQPRAFDTENKVAGGVLHRFFPNNTTVVNLAKSDGQVLVFDSVRTSPLTIIDIRAGLLLDSLETLSKIGFLDKAKAGELKIATLHVHDGSIAALDEIAVAAKTLSNERYYIVKNHINDRSFFEWSPERSASMNGGGTVIDIPNLDDLASEKVDDMGVGFEEFVRKTNSDVMRGYVNHWKTKVYAAFDGAGLGAM